MQPEAAMFAKFRLALKSDDGAVTVDWVVLSGAMVAMAVIMMATMNGEASDVATEIGTVLSDVEVATIGGIGYDR